MKSRNVLNEIDCIFSVNRDMIAGNGEDSFFYSANEKAAVVACFDGCGGSGARQYDSMSDKTGAYMASRCCAAAASDWFDEYSVDGNLGIEAYLDAFLEGLKSTAGITESRIRNSLSKEFPTTLALSTFTIRKSRAEADIFSAGDSRVYFLNADGLAQISIDDISDNDAMDNLTEDSKLRNVICTNAPYVINKTHLQLPEAGILITSTDGCFGYMKSPMDFEFLLINTLIESSSPAAYERNLANAFAEYAADDFTMCAVAYGFGTFDNLKTYFAPRRKLLYSRYVSPDSDRKAAWEQYRKGYYRFRKTMPSDSIRHVQAAKPKEIVMDELKDKTII